VRRALAAALIAALGGCTGVARGPAELVGAWTFVPHERFLGGFSAIEVSDDGGAFLLASDRGYLIRGAFGRTGGAIQGLRAWKVLPLRMPPDVETTSGSLDVESLATIDDETFVSLEELNEVWRIAPETGETLERLHPAWAEDLPSNQSLEALAVAADGTLYSLPEKAIGGAYPVYRSKGGAWERAFVLPRRGGYQPVGADVGPDGWLYVLERDWTIPVVFRSRVRRVRLDGTGEETLLETPTGKHDNLEGIAVWREAPGTLRLTLVSDDNYKWWQRTEFVEYRVGEGAP
jgi:hypothetical protein